MPASSRIGRFSITRYGNETVKAFIPPPLPPKPPVRMDRELQILLERATLALGRLDGVTRLLPDTALFIYFYVRKEAVLSSQIEGTQSSLSDLLLYESEEMPGVPLDDVQEVSHYVAALDFGLHRTRTELPLSSRLLKEMHRILLADGRGAEKTPGEFRRSQNWVGGTRPGNAVYVPPPHTEIVELMGDLERFLHDEPEPTPLLLKAALGHVQFETIHPFQDGNGRLGRLLITLLLCAGGALSEPLLYLSLYFKTYRQHYYDLLQRVRLEGAWEDWLRFFLTGVWETAEQAVDTAERITELFAGDRRAIETMGRQAGTALRVHRLLQQQPFVTVPAGARKLELSQPPVRDALKSLSDMGIVAPVGERKRNRMYCYSQYLRILDEGIGVA